MPVSTCRFCASDSSRVQPLSCTRLAICLFCRLGFVVLTASNCSIASQIIPTVITERIRRRLCLPDAPSPSWCEGPPPFSLSSLEGLSFPTCLINISRLSPHTVVPEYAHRRVAALVGVLSTHHAGLTMHADPKSMYRVCGCSPAVELFVSSFVLERMSSSHCCRKFVDTIEAPSLLTNVDESLRGSHL